MFRSVYALAAVIAVTALTGCVTRQQEEQQVVVAKYVNHAIKVDGKMSDPAWKTAVEYKLIPFVTHDTAPEKTAAAISKTKYWTDVWAKVLYDKENLYVGFRIENDDIHAMKPKDQEMLFLYGDTMEVFLKPVNSNSYLELYGNASGNKTTFFFPSRSFLNSKILEFSTLIPGLEVYSHVDGTLNNSKDIDKGWTLVMVIRRKMLEQQIGVPFNDKNPWTILLAGYAFSKNKIHSSNFAYPQMPQLNYHRTEYYAPLILEK